MSLRVTRVVAYSIAVVAVERGVASRTIYVGDSPRPGSSRWRSRRAFSPVAVITPAPASTRRI